MLNTLVGYLIDINQSKHALSQQKIDQLIHQFYEQLIVHAKKTNASDIHIEPLSTESRIRLRIDGVLHHLCTLPLVNHKQLVSKIKLLAHLDIAQKLLPQDGKLMFSQGINISMRISTCPTVKGEKIVLRLLESHQHALSISALHMPRPIEYSFTQHLQQSQGLILITGPTGSGKTSTLYAALHYLKQYKKNILTIEDPVEIQLDGINQVAINPKAQLTFATALRAFLRQDPDIIMIGEIRDKETADIALQAAHTGHLVLATLHTNSCTETIHRLIQLQIDYPLLISCLSLIISQRLLRKQCRNCLGKCCNECHDGYLGRKGIFEALSLTQELKDELRKKRHIDKKIAHLCSIYQPLIEQAQHLIQENITDEAEVRRVIIEHIF